MPVFDIEKPEQNTRYESPKGAPVERTETATLPENLAPELQAIADPITRSFIGIESFFEVLVRGGTWTYYSQEYSDQNDREGVYTTAQDDNEGFSEDTLYHIKPDGSLTIGHLRFRKDFIKDTKTNISSPTSKIIDILHQPIGLGATVTLEPIPGTEQTQPVLRYTEVRYDPLFDYKMSLPRRPLLPKKEPERNFFTDIKPILFNKDNFEKYNPKNR